MARIPKILKHFNIIVRGQGFAGVVDEVELPALKIKEEEHRAGGMDGVAPIDMGMEKLSMGITLAEHDRTVYSGFGIIGGNAVDLIFRGFQMGDTENVPMTVEARGMYSEIPAATVKSGDKNAMKGTISLRYYKLVIGGEVVIEIDVVGMKRIIGGQDQLAEARSAIEG